MPKMTCQRRAPKQTHQRAFLVGEIDRFQIKPGPESRILDRPQHLECGHHAQRGSEAAAVWNRIKMGPEEKCLVSIWRRWLSSVLRVSKPAAYSTCTGKDSGMVSRAVRAKLQPRFLDLFTEPLTRRKVRLTESGPVHAAITLRHGFASQRGARRTDLRQLVERVEHPI